MTAYQKRTFMVTQTMAKGFAELSKLALDESIGPCHMHFFAVRMLVEGRMPVNPLAALIGVAEYTPNNGECRLPCTAASVSAKLIQDIWQEGLMRYPAETKALAGFRWLFFEPEKVEECLKTMKQTEDPCMAKLVPLTIIVAQHELQAA